MISPEFQTLEVYRLENGRWTELDTYEGEQVNLDPFIREAILLEVPPFPLCSEDCQGIRPPPDSKESAVPSVDPRLAPLLALSAKVKNTPKD